MTSVLPDDNSSPFVGFRFPPEVILLAAGTQSFGRSYRELD